MKTLVFGTLVMAALVLAPMAQPHAQAGGSVLDYDAVSASATGDLEDVNIDDNTSCAEALTALLEAKGKIKHVVSGSDGAAIYTFEGKSKSTAVLLCAPNVP